VVRFKYGKTGIYSDVSGVTDAKEVFKTLPVKEVQR
jgi:hypothetical protein